jgi:glycine cleavage system aminomethyltransferase T
VRLAKGSFIGSDAVARLRDAAPGGPARRLRTVVVGDDPGYMPVYGGEAVRHNGEVVGRLRSVAYGYGVSRTVGYVYLPWDMQPGVALSVDVLGQRSAAVAMDVLRAGERMRQVAQLSSSAGAIPPARDLLPRRPRLGADLRRTSPPPSAGGRAGDG